MTDRPNHLLEESKKIVDAGESWALWKMAIRSMTPTRTTAMTDKPSLDHLMDLDPLSLSAKDIDDIIAYYRESMANFNAGIKPKKDAGPKLDLSKIIPTMPAPQKLEPIKRRG